MPLHRKRGKQLSADPNRPPFPWRKTITMYWNKTSTVEAGLTRDWNITRHPKEPTPLVVALRAGRACLPWHNRRALEEEGSRCIKQLLPGSAGPVPDIGASPISLPEVIRAVCSPVQQVCSLVQAVCSPAARRSE
ncbi:hypothetical protein PtB15_14B468 [Puccinia triticina]|nr:hypothetical protein PtB15_14B468 [Puccinia triticina]